MFYSSSDINKYIVVDDDAETCLFVIVYYKNETKIKVSHDKNNEPFKLTYKNTR